MARLFDTRNPDLILWFPQDRRRIEKEAFEGRLLGIVATNALELGVDIGTLDGVMMFGFPRGGIASFVRNIPLFSVNTAPHCTAAPTSRACWTTR